MVINYENIYHSKDLQNISTQIYIFGLKANHLATLMWEWVDLDGTSSFERASVSARPKPK
jgi:hypothetical protein